MGDSDEVPRALIIALAAVAVISFACGSTLELSRTGWLGAHPYWANLLSGVTGFSSSAFTISVIFRRMQVRQRRQDYLRNIRPEIEKAAAKTMAVAYQILVDMGCSPTPDEEDAFIGQEDPERQERAFRVLCAASGEKPFGVFMPSLVDLSSAIAREFESVNQMTLRTLNALNTGRAIEPGEYLLAIQTSMASNSRFWHAVRISGSRRAKILEDLTAASQAVIATGILDFLKVRDIADSFALARARAEQFAEDPDQGEAVARALTTLSRIYVGLPHTSVSPASITRLVDRCRTVAFRPLQLCADLIVAWALILDLMRHRRVSEELRAALAKLIPGADSLVATPTPLLPSRYGVNELLNPQYLDGEVIFPTGDDAIVTSASSGEQLIRSWYDQESVGDGQRNG